jgi:hypothetical protein
VILYVFGSRAGAVREWLERRRAGDSASLKHKPLSEILGGTRWVTLSESAMLTAAG